MNMRRGWRAGSFVAALFCGSVWGFGEATLGHLLHLARVPGLPGLVMFPFGVLVMGRVLARTGSAAAVFSTGVIAAGYKFFDLLLPGTDLLAVVNPAQAIILEALAASVWASLVTREMFPFSLPFFGPDPT
ncbi:MAG: hypothetical protein OEW05_04810 [Candidatus Aminicenantes bacterium]|nr:hypothetical protein [Candidatus Aminicenantes bacterium]